MTTIPCTISNRLCLALASGLLLAGCAGTHSIATRHGFDRELAMGRRDPGQHRDGRSGNGPLQNAGMVDSAVAPPSVIEGEIRGLASYYATAFKGRRTSSGEKFDPADLTCAHRTLPFGTKLKVTFLKTGKSVVVRVNDRGPFKHGRVLDLSTRAAREIGLVREGVGEIVATVVQD